MLDAQRSLGRTEPAIESLDGGAVGRSLFPLLPEDSFDAQPYVNRAERWMLVADARIDNRDELLRDLGIPPSPAISDAELLFRAYGSWRELAFQRLVGDFALAVWNGSDQSLILVRDHAGQRPLHYHVGEGLVAFASMPAGLLALEEVSHQVDSREVALFVADVPRMGSSSYFKGISRVESGQMVRITRGGVTTSTIWNPDDRELRYPRESDYVEAFREELDRAVKSRLRGAGAGVAAHLSAGLDSNAVAATAARVAPGLNVTAITAAPRLGFSGPVPHRRIADESPYAARTVRAYANMDHLVLRSTGASPLAGLEADARLFHQPIGNPCNHVWWTAANAAASERGLSVLLTGEKGNLTISAGTPSVLADLIRQGQWARWWQEARGSVGGSGPRWRGILFSSFAPWLPEPAWQAVKRLTVGRRGAEGGVSLLRDDWRRDLLDLAAAQARGGQPEKDTRLMRLRLLRRSDPGSFRKGSLARWGIDERDPTSDRRLTEFCLSLPPELLFGDGFGRRIARLGLADRLSPDLLDAPRGYQFADWYEAVDPMAIARQIDQLEERLGRSSVVDFEAVRRLLAAWPDSDWGSGAVITTFRVMLLYAVSAAEFEAAFRQ